jgi:hypothetical protein
LCCPWPMACIYLSDAATNTLRAVFRGRVYTPSPRPTNKPVCASIYLLDGRRTEVDSRSHSQEVSRLLWNTKVHYRVHRSLRMEPVLKQTNPVHTITPFLRSIFISPCHKYQGLSSGLFPSGFPTTSTIRATSPSHLLLGLKCVGTVTYVMHLPTYAGTHPERAISLPFPRVASESRPPKRLAYVSVATQSPCVTQQGKSTDN